MSAGRRPPRLAFFVFAVEKNTLGRAYSLWLTSEAIGSESQFVAPRMASPWPPLASEHSFLERLTVDAEDAARWADVLVALKPWPGCFDTALKLGKSHGKPVVLDVDDPDWEASFGESWRRQLVNFASLSLKGRPPAHAYRLRYLARSLPRITMSNPALQRWYGPGTVVPHARLPRPEAARSTGEAIEVAFVGTQTDHKGIELLRQAAAVARVERLTITADAPDGTLPHERWIGQTSLAEGLDVIDTSDVVAVASRPWTYGRGQLPAKLIDAMMAGRAIVASDLEPISWALDGSGILVAPDDLEGLTEALLRLRSPSLRAELGEKARRRALNCFTPEAIAPSLSSGLGYGPAPTRS